MKKLFFLASVLLSFIVLIYFFYKSEIIANGANRSYYVKYYMLMGGYLFVSLVLIFTNEKIQSLFFYPTVIFILSIFLFELSLHYTEFRQVNLIKKKVKNFNKQNYDGRQRYEVYMDLKKKIKTVSLGTGPNTFLDKNITDSINSHKLFPLSSKSFSETITCNANGRYATYFSDRYGFNNPDDQWEDDIEFLFIGDSFTSGCEKRPNDIPSVIRDETGKVTINLSLPGSGPLIEYASLREYTENRSVKNIIWMFYEKNDLEEIANELNNSLLKKYFMDKNFNFSQGLINKQDEVDKIIDKVNQIELAKGLIKSQEKTPKNKLINFIKLVKTRSFFENQKKTNAFKSEKKEFDKTSLKDFNELVKLIKSFADKKKSNLFFVYLPEVKRYKDFKENDKLKNVKNIIIKNNIQFINIHEEVFEKENAPIDLFTLEILKFNYYNTKGFKKVALAIKKKLD